MQPNSFQKTLCCPDERRQDGKRSKPGITISVKGYSQGSQAEKLT